MDPAFPDDHFGNVTPTHGMLPSQFMRRLRPENYSDTKDRTTVLLRPDQFEYHLETITSRNQTHDFELFCRKLCERAICPDLRAQTGPEGGGDSQVDTETLPVSEEVRERYYEGVANQGAEKWAFAISAEKKWTAKARRDVRKIAETGRGYQRIFFITSRHARARDRARLEDELGNAYGVPVTIHDRTWLVCETVEKDRADLAYNFLNVGELVRSGQPIGPKDYSRVQQLEDIERGIKNPTAFAGMEVQLSSEALAAAKLSRNLERPRAETDGRFHRAIKLSAKYGTPRQKLEARYEHIWTAYWWFDDIDFLLSEYEAFEKDALQSDQAVDLEWLGNLHQLLVNSVTHGHATLEESQLLTRADRLQTKLEILAKEITRPNNRLEARAAILRIELNRAMLAQDRNRLPQIWIDYAEVVEAARGLGEFSFDTLIRFIDVAGQIAGNDPSYNALVEKCARGVAERTSESEAALIYLKRAKKLGPNDAFDAIRWLGKAAVGLAKREYAEELAEATSYLAVAYRSAGLLWAARASCVMSMATLFIEGERANEVPVEIVPLTKLSAWISLELCHLPDALGSIQLFNGLRSGLPLDEPSKKRTTDDLHLLDVALGSLILNLSDADLVHLNKLPDLLQGLDLYMAHMALLYSLGHLETLRAEGAIPDHETDDAISELMGQLKARDLAETSGLPLVLNQFGAQSLVSTILGMRVSVHLDSEDLIPVAEAILGALEAFFATAIEQHIVPHAEEYQLVLRVEDLNQPQIATDRFEMTTRVVWPRGLDIGDFDRGGDIRETLLTLASHVLATSCLTPDSDDFIERLFRDEAVHYRISMVAAFSNSYSRINNKRYSRLSDWDKHDLRFFSAKLPRPFIADMPKSPHSARSGSADDTDLNSAKNHRRLRVRSVIDLPIWEKARWRGCGYLQIGEDLPPFIALLFEDAAAGRKIFERWRKRFGATDENDEIAISIIRKLPGWDPHHYIIQVASSPPRKEASSAKVFAMPSRSQEMTPITDENVDRFLSAYKKFGVYAIAPAFLPGSVGAQPEFNLDLAIEKRALAVKDATDIKEPDLEAMALRVRGIPIGV